MGQPDSHLISEPKLGSEILQPSHPAHPLGPWCHLRPPPDRDPRPPWSLDSELPGVSRFKGELFLNWLVRPPPCSCQAVSKGQGRRVARAHEGCDVGRMRERDELPPHREQDGVFIGISWAPPGACVPSAHTHRHFSWTWGMRPPRVSEAGVRVPSGVGPRWEVGGPTEPALRAQLQAHHGPDHTVPSWNTGHLLQNRRACDPGACP